MSWIYQFIFKRAFPYVWALLDGKKTKLGVLLSLLAVVIQLFRVMGNEPLAQTLEQLLTAATSLGVDPLLTAGEVTVFVGLLHKVVKALKALRG